MFQQLRDRLKLMSSEPHVLYWFALLSSLLRLRFSMLADTARVTNVRIIIIIIIIIIVYWKMYFLHESDVPPRRSASMLLHLHIKPLQTTPGRSFQIEGH